MKHRKALGITALLIFGLIVLCADMKTLPLWLRLFFSYPGGDKVGHILVASLMSLAFNLSFGGRTAQLGEHKMPTGSILILILMTAEELSQALLSTRTFSWADLACDYLGIAFVSLIVKKYFLV